MDNDEELLSAENFADQILKSASNGNFMAIQEITDCLMKKSNLDGLKKDGKSNKLLKGSFKLKTNGGGNSAEQINIMCKQAKREIKKNCKQNIKKHKFNKPKSDLVISSDSSDSSDDDII